ncbi:unnamed protein product [Closterium sp. NIES-65]|nr:unnamed protein product [Closterium sp. NIES-65]
MPTATVRSQWATRDAYCTSCAAKKSIVAVGASHGDPRTPIFEGCSPSPLLPSVASAAAANLLALESVGAASALAGDAAQARARGAGALEERAGAVEVEVEAAGGVGVAVGVEVGVEVSVAAVEEEAAAAAAVAVGAEVAEVAAVEAAVVTEAAEAAGGGGGAGPRVYAEEWLRWWSAASSSSADRETLSPQQLREWYTARQRGGDFGPSTYVLRTGDRAGEQCGGCAPHPRCFGRLTNAWHHQFPEATEIPRWGEVSRTGVAIYDLDFDAILSAMYAVSISDEGDCYRCFPPDPGIETAALGSPPVSCGSLWHPVWSLPPLVLYELVSGADLQDGGVHQFTPARQRVTHCTEASTGNTWLCLLGRQRAAPHSSQFSSDRGPVADASNGRVGPSPRPWKGGGESAERVSSGLLRAYCRARGIRQTFTLPDSPQQNGIAERRIGMVMDVARTSTMHAAAPHFLWPNCGEERLAMPSAFRVWGSRAFVRDLSADKLSPRAAAPCVFLGFPPDAPEWQFYHPTSRRVLFVLQDVTFDESVPYYRLFPYRTPSLPLPPLLPCSRSPSV